MSLNFNFRRRDSKNQRNQRAGNRRTKSLARFEMLEVRRYLSADGLSRDIDSPTEEARGLLLPAVQKVQEAAERTEEIGDLKNPSENAKIGLLLPAVQKVREAAAKLEGEIGDIANPEEDEDALIGLLLPAVQKVREAASRLEEIGDIANPEGNSPVGLLLPAVQKVREAAAKLEELGGDLRDVDNPEDEDALIGLLLPAVQKVREAAEHTEEIGDLKNPSENAKIGLLLPAVQKVREAAGRMQSTDAAFEEIDDFLGNEDEAVALLLPAVQKVQAAAGSGGGPHVKVFDGTRG